MGGLFSIFHIKSASKAQKTCDFAYLPRQWGVAYQYHTTVQSDSTVPVQTRLLDLPVCILVAVYICSELSMAQWLPVCTCFCAIWLVVEPVVVIENLGKVVLYTDNAAMDIAKVFKMLFRSGGHQSCAIL